MMADIHGSPADAPQAPAAGSGPAPVPYAGADQSPQASGPPVPVFATPGPDVMSSVSAAMGVQEAGYAHDVNAGLVTPYAAGQPSAIFAGGDADAGGRDDVAGTVAGAVAAAEARFTEHEHDTHAQGSVIGDVVTLPPNPLDPGVGSTGTTDPAGGFYDPPRSYGG